jgi:hypothetical protein
MSLGLSPPIGVFYHVTLRLSVHLYLLHVQLPLCVVPLLVRVLDDIGTSDTLKIFFAAVVPFPDIVAGCSVRPFILYRNFFLCLSQCFGSSSGSAWIRIILVA